MTETRDFTQRVERELRASRGVSESICEAAGELPPESRAAFAKAMRFLGCKNPDSPPGGKISTCEVDRIQASRFMLLELCADTNDPRWSSWRLDRLLEAVMETPGGCVSDLLHALYEMLGEHLDELSITTRHLIADIVIKCFTGHRASYEASEFIWMVQKTIEGSTQAQAYLALLAIPPSVMQTHCAIAILKALAGTPYWTEAMNNLLPVPEAPSLTEIEWEGLRKVTSTK